MNKRILFIGPINKGRYPLGGDQYKNQLLVKSFSPRFDWVSIDTNKWKKRPSVLMKLLFNLISHARFDRVIISASTDSAVRFIKLIRLFPKLPSKTIYWVIGGILGQKLKTGGYQATWFSPLRVVVVETEKMRSELSSAGLTHLTLAHNFKDFSIEKIMIRQSQKPTNPEVRFLFLSRICREKGVDLIFEALQELATAGCKAFLVDFYGPIAADYESSFREKAGNCKNVRYQGILNLVEELEQNYDRLSHYDVFLFPTLWKSEGHAGALIDAQCCGLATIATDWNSNAEFVRSNYNGEILSANNSTELGKAMKMYINNRSKLREHQQNAFKNAKRYHIDHIAPLYLETIR